MTSLAPGLARLIFGAARLTGAASAFGAAAVGFSGGAAFAGGLVLDDPARYLGAAILYGTLPFDAGVPTTPGHLEDRRVFLSHGAADTVIPLELQQRTWQYLTGASGADVWARRDQAGHQITQSTLVALGHWLQGQQPTQETPS